jgi:hypothetical protein
VVPLAAVTVTQEEWDALGKHAVAQMPRNQRSIAFGMLLEPLDDADRAHVMHVLPAPVRMLAPLPDRAAVAEVRRHAAHGKLTTS